MKYTFHLFFALFVAFTACQNKKENAAHEHSSEAKTDAPVDTLKKSIPKEEHAEIGGTHFTIKYHAPAVRGRTIWGGLVPYGVCPCRSNLSNLSHFKLVLRKSTSAWSEPGVCRPGSVDFNR